MLKQSQEKTEEKGPVINRITHKELQILYNLSKGGAKHRLTAIRNSLGKKGTQYLTVIDFVNVEGMTVEEFDILMKRGSFRST